MKARFEVGDRICEKMPRDNTKVGTVVAIYQFQGDTRYVAQFDDGTEAVFFELEICPEKLIRKAAAS